MNAQLENQIGLCRPLYATYSNVYFDVCEDAVDGIVSDPLTITKLLYV